tara:strand:+ start:57085 stop:57672 length:588 start_codon:yes stop_codon:yes gene_type:complete
MLKRFLDIILSLFGIIIFSPVFTAIAVIIKITSKGSIFFVQKRVGQHAKIFKMFKFRTMCNNSGSNTISVLGDERITNVGAILRKYKLDELPELVNVLLGDMSFVGPRPDVPGYADLLAGENRNILKLRPGITGPASIKYSNEEEILSKKENPIQYNNNIIYPDKVRLNLEYYYNNSTWVDIKIIFATLSKIFKF